MLLSLSRGVFNYGKYRGWNVYFGSEIFTVILLFRDSSMILLCLCHCSQSINVIRNIYLQKQMSCWSLLFLQSSNLIFLFFL